MQAPRRRPRLQHARHALGRPGVAAGIAGACLAWVAGGAALLAGSHTLVVTWWVPVNDCLAIALYLAVAGAAASDAQLRRDGVALPIAAASMAVAALWVPDLLLFPGVVSGAAATAGQQASGIAYGVAHIGTAALPAAVLTIRVGRLRRPGATTAVFLGCGLLGGALFAALGQLAAPHLPATVLGLAFTPFNRVLLGIAMVPTAIALAAYLGGRRADPRTEAPMSAAVGIVSVEVVIAFIAAGRYTPLWYAATALRTLAPLALVVGQVTLYRFALREQLRQRREAVLLADIARRLARTLDLPDALGALEDAASSITAVDAAPALPAKVFRLDRGRCVEARAGVGSGLPSAGFPLADDPYLASVVASGGVATAAVEGGRLRPGIRGVVGRIGLRHGAWARLDVGGAPWGIIAVGSADPKGFDANILGRLSVLASLAELAIANALAHQGVSDRDRLHGAMLDTLTEGIVVATARGMTSVNPGAKAMLGVSWDKVTNLGVADASWAVVDSQGRPVSADTRPLAATLRSGVAQKAQVLGVMRPDGATRWLSVSCAPLVRDGPWDPATSSVVASFTDVTRLFEAEAAARREEGRYRLLATNSTDVISRNAPDGTYLYASPSAYRVLGYRPDELIGRTSYSLVHPQDMPAVTASIAAVRAGDSRTLVTCRVRRKDGVYVWMETSAHIVRDGRTGLVTEIQNSTRDVAARQRAYDDLAATNLRLAELALTDPLTGLSNRRGFERAMATRSRHRYAILAIDIDNLKAVNDADGHEGGDLLITTIAATISATLRSGDLLARVGGDELVALVQDVDEARATSTAQRMRSALRSAGTGTVSIGCSSAPGTADPTDVWRTADEALYMAKRGGRDRIVVMTYLPARVAVPAAPQGAERATGEVAPRAPTLPPPRRAAVTSAAGSGTAPPSEPRQTPS